LAWASTGDPATFPWFAANHVGYALGMLWGFVRR